MIAACEGTSHSFTVVSSEHDRTCVWSREENFVTCTGCLCESNVRRIAREFMSKIYKRYFQQTESASKDSCPPTCRPKTDIARTWTRPVSSPATTSFPSPRMHPLRATSLKRDIVLVTFCVLGAYICTRVAAVTAYRWGLEGEKCTEVTGAYSLMKTGCLYCRQKRDSALCFVDAGRACLRTTTGW